MKSIHEAALNYSNDITPKVEGRGIEIEKAFLAGAKFAQRFISVNDELPEDIETEGRTHIPCIVTNGDTKTIAFRRLSPLTKKWNWNVMMEVTHWRPIDIK